VMEGRDIGTRVFPGAPVKIFLDASREVRAERRWRQLRTAGRGVSREEALEDVRRRDRRDTSREDSPLTCDDTYVRIDTSDLDPSEAVEAVLAVIRRSME
jgi:cytidylate kinase